MRARRIAGGLFFATCTSVFVVRVVFWETGAVVDDPAQLERALVFTCVLMGILLAHELGHYAVARGHGFRLSLPWFIPAPILVGTLGAIIQLEESPKTRSGLLEMGAAGPIGGVVVVVAAMIGGILTGQVDGGTELSRPLLWHGLSWVLMGESVPLTTADPVGFAAWLGCLLTAMNLLPFGQLDGGHITAAAFPAWASRIGWGTTALLLAGGFIWPGWAVWAGILHLLGTRLPVVPKTSAPLSRRARGVGAVSVLVWILCFTPVPIP